MAPDSEVILKGSNPNFDSYSAFFDNQRLGQTKLQAKLEKLNITDVYVGGLATDYCVGEFHFKSPIFTFLFEEADEMTLSRVHFTPLIGAWVQDSGFGGLFKRNPIGGN